jgi:hypothetical protein
MKEIKEKFILKEELCKHKKDKSIKIIAIIKKVEVYLNHLFLREEPLIRAIE